MTDGQPRTRELRKVDTLAAPAADVWVATAAAGAGGLGPARVGRVDAVPGAAAAADPGLARGR
jgi:hypothetical protein